MIQHTPGPWIVDTGCFHSGNLFAITHKIAGCSDDEPMFPTIAEVWPADNGQDEADARLIASAPDLNLYREYIERNMDRIERGGWTPVGFAEYVDSEEIENDRVAKTKIT